MFFISVRDEFNISSFNDSRPRSCRQLMRFSPLVNTIGNFLDALTLISVKLNDTGRCWVAININYNSTGSWLISSSTYHRTTREDRRETNVVNRSVDYSRHAYVSKLNTGPGLFRLSFSGLLFGARSWLPSRFESSRALSKILRVSTSGCVRGNSSLRQSAGSLPSDSEDSSTRAPLGWKRERFEYSCVTLVDIHVDVNGKFLSISKIFWWNLIRSGYKFLLLFVERKNTYLNFYNFV